MSENKEAYVQDDEIDLIELFKTVLGYKIPIILMTVIFGILGFLYAFVLATPKYEVSATFENGYYKTVENGKEIKNPLNEITSVLEELKTKWIKNLEQTPNLEFKFKNIEMVKETSDKFNVNLLSNSNDIGVTKINQILYDLQSEDEKVLNVYVNSINEKIDFNRQNMDILSKKGNDLKYALNKTYEDSKNLDSQIEKLSNFVSNENNSSVELAISRLADLKNIVENKILNINSAIVSNQSNIVDLKKFEKELEMKIIPENIVRTNIISNIVTYENPVQPKKALILIISVFVGFFISVFGVLVFDIIKYKK